MSSDGSGAGLAGCSMPAATLAAAGDSAPGLTALALGARISGLAAFFCCTFMLRAGSFFACECKLSALRVLCPWYMLAGPALPVGLPRPGFAICFWGFRLLFVLVLCPGTTTCGQAAFCVKYSASEDAARESWG